VLEISLAILRACLIGIKEGESTQQAKGGCQGTDRAITRHRERFLLIIPLIRQTHHVRPMKRCHLIVQLDLPHRKMAIRESPAIRSGLWWIAESVDPLQTQHGFLRLPVRTPVGCSTRLTRTFVLTCTEVKLIDVSSGVAIPFVLRPAHPSSAPLTSSSCHILWLGVRPSATSAHPR